MNENILQEHYYCHFIDSKTLVIGATECFNSQRYFNCFIMPNFMNGEDEMKFMSDKFNEIPICNFVTI